LTTETKAVSQEFFWFMEEDLPLPGSSGGQNDNEDAALQKEALKEWMELFKSCDEDEEADRDWARSDHTQTKGEAYEHLRATHPATFNKLLQMRHSSMERKEGATAAEASNLGAKGAPPDSLQYSEMAKTHPVTAKRLQHLRATSARRGRKGQRKKAGREEITILPGMKQLTTEEIQQKEAEEREKERIKRLRAYKHEAAAKKQTERWKQEQREALLALCKGRKEAFADAHQAALLELCGANRGNQEHEGEPSSGLVMGADEIGTFLKVLGMTKTTELAEGAGQAVAIPIHAGLVQMRSVLSKIVGRTLEKRAVKRIWKELKGRLCKSHALDGCEDGQRFHDWQVLDWGVNEVCDLMMQLGLPTEEVEAKGVNGALLMEMTEQEIYEDLGITFSLPRQRFLYHLAVLKHMSKWNLRHGARLAAALAAHHTEESEARKIKKKQKDKAERKTQKKKKKKKKSVVGMGHRRDSVPGVTRVESDGGAMDAWGSSSGESSEEEGEAEVRSLSDVQNTGGICNQRAPAALQGKRHHVAAARDLAIVEKLRAEMGSVCTVKGGAKYYPPPAELLDPQSYGVLKQERLIHMLYDLNVGTTIGRSDLARVLQHYAVNAYGDIDYNSLLGSSDSVDDDGELSASRSEGHRAAVGWAGAAIRNSSSSSRDNPLTDGPAATPREAPAENVAACDPMEAPGMEQMQAVVSSVVDQVDEMLTTMAAVVQRSRESAASAGGSEAPPELVTEVEWYLQELSAAKRKLLADNSEVHWSTLTQHLHELSTQLEQAELAFTHLDSFSFGSSIASTGPEWDGDADMGHPQSKASRHAPATISIVFEPTRGVPRIDSRGSALLHGQSARRRRNNLSQKPSATWSAEPPVHARAPGPRRPMASTMAGIHDAPLANEAASNSEVAQLKEALDKAQKETQAKEQRLKLCKRQVTRLRKANEMIGKAAGRGWQGATTGTGVAAKVEQQAPSDKAGQRQTTLKEKQAKLLHQTAQLATLSDSARLAKLKTEVSSNAALTNNKALKKRIEDLEATQKEEQNAWADRIGGAYE
jgi:hypothetical protein